MRLLRQGWLIRYRRTFGLFAFFYACVHLTVYAVLDVELTWSDMVADVAKRLYITIGMTALVLMIPLAVTSTKGWIRRMGNKRWNALHRLVYVSAVLGLVHYWMSVKKDITEPALFGLVFAVLLGWRAWRSWGHRSRAEGVNRSLGASSTARWCAHHAHESLRLTRRAEGPGAATIGKRARGPALRRSRHFLSAGARSVFHAPLDSTSPKWLQRYRANPIASYRGDDLRTGRRSHAENVQPGGSAT